MHTLHRINIARFGSIFGNDFVKYVLIKVSSAYNKKEIEIWYRLIVKFRGTRNIGDTHMHEFVIKIG